jgi:membrane protein YdbS with pleckstrin-like domain
MAGFCPRCGKPVGGQDLFCKSCGAELSPNAPAVAPAAPEDRASGSVPATPDLGSPYEPIPTPTDLPFRLQDGEVVYREIRPGRKLFWRFAFGGVLGAVVFLVLAAILFFLFALVGSAGTGLLILPAILVGLGALLLVAAIPTGWLAYTKFRFWITNQRTVGRRGVVSYSVDSIPLETISDVIISRSVVDRLLGLSSLYIQPFGGAGFYPPQSAGAGSQFQSSNTFPGLTADEAVAVQQQILHLRTVRRSATGRLL